MEAEGVPDSTQMNGKIIMKNSRGEVLYEISREKWAKDKSPQAYFAEEKLSDSGLYSSVQSVGYSADVRDQTGLL